MPTKLFIIAGEKSGDIHAAEVVKEWLDRHPDTIIKGMGGPDLQSATNNATRDWLDQSAVMGFVEVLKKYRYFKERFDETIAEILEFNPHLILFVDYPGFNLRVAKAIRKQKLDCKMVQYVCPQVWAWKKDRIPKIAKLLDEVLCILPFEPQLFDKYKRDHRFQATFVGHPLVDELPFGAGEARSSKLVALLPGSREKEVRHLLPLMLNAAAQLRHQLGQMDIRCAIPAASPKIKALIEELAPVELNQGLITFHEGGSHDLMKKAICGIIASGTATLEAGCLGLPYVLIYKTNLSTYLIAWYILGIRRVGLVNILADKTVIKELLQFKASPKNIAQELHRIITDYDYRFEMVKSLGEVKTSLGKGGIHQRVCNRMEAQLHMR